VTAGLATARLSVRRASPDDLDTVVALRLALLREECQRPAYGRVRPGVARRAHALYRAQLESPGEVTLLAERDGVVLGILRCAESSGHPLLEPDRYAYVSSVYVVPAARRSGVVRALLGHASQWCRDRGLVEMRLHNAVDSAIANAAWEALGFTVVEHLRVRRVPDAGRQPAFSGHRRSRSTEGARASSAHEPDRAPVRAHIER
jgi:ribosomal protein S18 acetylase RimI-like enzyme